MLIEHGIFREDDMKQNMPIARGVLKRTDSKPHPVNTTSKYSI
jgi:hypothetical protein